MSQAPVSRPRVLFVYPFEAPFITTDLELLRTFCEVSPLYFQGRGDYARLLGGVRASDVVFSWFALPYAATAAGLAYLSGRTAIVVAGGWDVARIPEIGYGRPLTVRGAISARIALSLSDSVLAFSESSADLVRQIAPGSPVRTAYLGIDTSAFRPGPKENLVVTIANVTTENVVRKGLRQFVEAARNFPDVRFVLVGRHMDDAIERLREAAPSNASFTGWLPEVELRDLLAAAKVYVQSSFIEGFGVALAEAMASGCVPVVTRRGAIPELVGDCGFYVTYGDTDSLSAGIRSALMSSLGDRARGRILEHFTLAHRLEALRDIVLGHLDRSVPRIAGAVSIQREPKGNVMLSICTTNYNCAHALREHLQSVYGDLSGIEFEYIVVDNMSTDRSREILKQWEASHPNMRVLEQRCTMGEGRQIAFRQSTGTHIMVIDTDVVYSHLLRRFVDRYLETYSDVSIQALYCGIFPREQWIAVGGRRSLNTNEDLDMWVRLAQRDWIRWYPVAMGVNLKDPDALGSFDHLSSRYPRRERIVRLARRQWDLWKTRRVRAIDIAEMIHRRTVALNLDVGLSEWPQSRARQSASDRVLEFVRQLKQTLNEP